MGHKKINQDILDTYWYLFQYKLPDQRNIADRELFDKMMLSIISQMRAKDDLIASLKCELETKKMENKTHDSDWKTKEPADIIKCRCPRVCEEPNDWVCRKKWEKPRSNKKDIDVDINYDFHEGKGEDNYLL